MNVVSINRSPDEERNAVTKAQADFQALIEQFIEDNPHFTVSTLLGVLRLVEHNLIERYV